MINKAEIMEKASRTFYRTGLKLSKASPKILVVAGIVAMAGAAVLASIETTHAHEVIETLNKDLDEIKEVSQMAEVDYDEKTKRKDLTIAYGRAAFGFAKLYAPSIALGTLGATSILVGHNILHKRSLAISAAYTALDQTFKDYRKRVVQEYGEEIDYNLRHGITEEVVKHVNEDGTVIEKVEKKVPSIPKYDEYSKFFDESCCGWVKDAESNLLFVRFQQDQANQKLRLQGHLFLNEVYDMFDIPRTAIGQRVGWVYDPENPVYVDFGVYNNEEAKRRFVNGLERSILLEFNVQGDICSILDKN